MRWECALLIKASKPLVASHADIVEHYLTLALLP